MKFFKRQITFFLSFIFAINAYSQTSTLKHRVENDELSREKKINTYIAQNNVQKRRWNVNKHFSHSRISQSIGQQRRIETPPV